MTQNREKQKDELRDKHQKHQAQQVQDQLRQRKGLPEASGDRAARQRVAALGDGSAGLAPASVKAGGRTGTGGKKAVGGDTAGSSTPGWRRSHHIEPDPGQSRGGQAGAETPGRAVGDRKPNSASRHPSRPVR